MLSKKMEAALNAQINAEMFSSYLYLSMSSWFEDQSLPGFAHWMKNQAQEEMVHGMKIYQYVLDRGGRVKLEAIDAPETEWESAKAVFQAVLDHERKVTGMINDLYGLSEELRDYATRVFLHWFIDEQVEEEATADEWLQKVTRVENSPSGLFQVDREAASRIFDLAGALSGE